MKLHFEGALTIGFVRAAGDAGGVLLREENRAAKLRGADEYLGRLLGHQHRGQNGLPGSAQRDDAMVLHQNDARLALGWSARWPNSQRLRQT